MNPLPAQSALLSLSKEVIKTTAAPYFFAISPGFFSLSNIPACPADGSSKRDIIMGQRIMKDVKKVNNLRTDPVLLICVLHRGFRTAGKIFKFELKPPQTVSFIIIAARE